MNASKSLFVFRTIFRRILFEFFIGLYALVAAYLKKKSQLIDVQKTGSSDRKCITILEKSTLSIILNPLDPRQNPGHHSEDILTRLVKSEKGQY